MTTLTTRRVLTGFCALSTLLTCLAVTAAGQTTTTQKLSGTVRYVEGNTLVVAMSSGDLRQFTVPESRKFIIDGQEKSVHDLQPGTHLNATITTTTTPTVQRTVQTLTGTVWYVAGNTVILTLPDGQNKMYKAQPHFKFKVDGQDADVSALRKGMRISAEKITEEPITEVASNTTVTGSAPKPKPVVAQSGGSSSTPTPMPVKKAAAPAPVQVAAAPAPEPVADPTPSKLPKTASPLPLAGMLGLLFTSAGFGLRRLRRP